MVASGVGGGQRCVKHFEKRSHPQKLLLYFIFSSVDATAAAGNRFQFSFLMTDQVRSSCASVFNLHPSAGN